MSTATIYRRVLRRETTSPRSTLAIIVASILILASAYAITEIILAAFGQPPLIVAPADMLGALPAVSTVIPVVLAVIGAVVALVGLLLIVAALTAGRRHRHVVTTERIATVVDDEVIASAVARTAALESNVSPDNARVSVSRRRAFVRVTPASGTAVAAPSITTAATARLASFDLKPAVTPKVTIEKGRVGA